MNRWRDLIVANAAALLVLLTVLLLGWWQEAALGLAVLLFLDLFVALRGRQARSVVDADAGDEAQAPGEGDKVGEGLPGVSYEVAKQAYEGGHKLHMGEQIFLVRPALRENEEGLVLWVTDERTRGDHGWLLYPGGRVEAK